SRSADYICEYVTCSSDEFIQMLVQTYARTSSHCSSGIDIVKIGAYCWAPYVSRSPAEPEGCERGIVIFKAFALSKKTSSNTSSGWMLYKDAMVLSVNKWASFTDL